MKLRKGQFKDLAQLSMFYFTPEEAEQCMQDLDLIIDFTQKSEQTQDEKEIAESFFTLCKGPSFPKPESSISKATFNKHFSTPYFRLSHTREGNS